MVHVKVAGARCVGRVVDYRFAWGSDWLLIEPVAGFHNERWVLFTDVRF